MPERADRVRLRSISPDATPEEVAAITAAITAALTDTRAVAAEPEPEERSLWVQATRITARRGGYSRGEWRLSGRIGRRSRT